MKTLSMILMIKVYFREPRYFWYFELLKPSRQQELKYQKKIPLPGGKVSLGKRI